MSDFNRNDYLTPGARLRRIQEFLIEHGSLSLREAVTELGVSEMTLRRDFIQLEQAGLAERTWGGLLAKQGLVPELSLEERREQEPVAKQTIAELADAQIGEGETIFLSGGSTAMTVARQLLNRKKLSVITTSLSALMLLARNTELNVIALGGKASPYNDDLTGPQVLDALDRFRADTAILGASGITEEGIFNANLERGAINQKMIEHAQRTLVVADHSKIGRNALVLLVEPNPALTVITDSAPPSRILDAFRDFGSRIEFPRQTGRRDGQRIPRDASSA